MFSAKFGCSVIPSSPPSPWAFTSLRVSSGCDWRLPSGWINLTLPDLSVNIMLPSGRNASDQGVFSPDAITVVIGKSPVGVVISPVVVLGVVVTAVVVTDDVGGVVGSVGVVIAGKVGSVVAVGEVVGELMTVVVRGVVT